MLANPKSDMKIVIFSSSFFPVKGGVQEVAFRLAKEFKKKGHKIRVVTQRCPRNLKEKEMLEDISVYRILFPNLFPSTFKLNLLLKYLLGLFLAPFSLFKLFLFLCNEKPQIVYLHFVGIGSFYLLVCRLFIPFKLVATLHGDDVEGLPYLSRFHKWLFVKTCESADFVTACSVDLLQKGRALCPTIAGKSAAIHNGINLREFQEIKAYKHIRPYLFAAGRFVHKKGFDVLIKAFHKLLNNGYKLDFILAGDGIEIEACKNLAENLSIRWINNRYNTEEAGPRLIFWGWANRDEMKSLLAGSEIFVVPSRKEPFGLVVLEAMAIGAPIIASNVGGIPEIMLDGNGLLVPPEDDNALSIAIEKLLNEKDLREDIAKLERSRAKEFSWDKTAQAYLSLANKLTEQNGMDVETLS